MAKAILRRNATNESARLASSIRIASFPIRTGKLDRCGHEPTNPFKNSSEMADSGVIIATQHG
jgi:hypothetical protein